MSDIIQVATQIEQKVKDLIVRSNGLEQKSKSLGEELRFYKKRFEQTEEEISDLQKQIETLKTANALLGSDDFKRETKTKINSIVREIDNCIVQLSD